MPQSFMQKKKKSFKKNETPIHLRHLKVLAHQDQKSLLTGVMDLTNGSYSIAQFILEKIDCSQSGMKRTQMTNDAM